MSRTRRYFIVDDMISTGGTMLRAAAPAASAARESVHALATHGVFGKGADALFADESIGRIVVTDSLDSAAGWQSAARKSLSLSPAHR